MSDPAPPSPYFVMPSTNPASSLRGIGGATRVLLLVYAGVSLLSILTAGWGIVELNGFSAGIVGPDALTSYSLASVIVTVLSLTVLLTTGICWLVWQRRAAASFPVGVLRRSPGWHVGSWVIPIVSLWFPFQNVSDLARSSRAALGGGILGAWWVLWIVGGLAGGLVRGTGLQTISSLTRALSISIVSDGLLIAASVLAWIVVSRITAAIDPS